MEKIKKVKKPIDNWDIIAMEEWFSDMARQGLEIVKIGFYYAHFRVTEPKNLVYKIVINKNMPVDEKEEYAKYGWNFQLLYGRYYSIMSSCNRNQINEILYDEKEAIKKFSRSKNREVLFSLGLLMIWIIILIYNGYGYENFIYAIIIGKSGSLLVLSLLNILQFLRGIDEVRNINRIKRAFLEGRRENTGMPFNGTSKVKKVIDVAIAVSFIIFLMIFIQNYILSNAISLEKTSADIPVVRVTDINDSLDFGDQNFYWENKSTLLLKKQFRLNESTYIDGKRIGIHENIYELRFESMSEPLLMGMISKSRKADDLKKLNYVGFDNIYVAEYGGIKEIYITKGNIVASFNCWGDWNFDHIISIINKKLKI